jgi:hypothetical protein
MKRKLAQSLVLCILLFTIGALIPQCKKEEGKKTQTIYQSDELKGLTWRKSMNEEELRTSIISKLVTAEDGSAYNNNRINAGCDMEGDIYTTRYEFTSCQAGQRILNFYVQVIYGTGTIPEDVKLTIRQRMDATNFRETTVSPSSYVQVETGHREYFFELNTSNFDLCTQGTTEIYAKPHFLLRCPATRDVIYIETSQSLGVLDYNCKVYNYTVTTTSGQATFTIPITTCSTYGNCSVNPVSFVYQYRLKGTTTWNSSPAISNPYTYTVNLPSGTYETRAYTPCSAIAYSPMFEFTMP